jgi:ADP-ribose pyrophosphatase YjhB (NUDIX family)/predicted transcriptional regulator
MHEIQKEILKKLSEHKKATYSTLKRKDLEGNIFNYHLKVTIKEKYVKHKEKEYSLTAKGKHFVDRVSSVNFSERIQPKIITVVILKKGNKYLLYKRKKQPFLDQVGFVHGKIHLEERVVDAASRELSEKSGLQAKLKYRGHMYMTIHDEMELVSSMMCYIYTGNNITGELFKDFPKGECYWGSLETVPTHKLFPGITHMLRLIQKHPTDIFFEEYSLNTTDEE